MFLLHLRQIIKHLILFSLRTRKMSRYILAIAIIVALLHIGLALPTGSEENVAPDNEIEKINSELDRIDEEEEALLQAIDDDRSDEDEANAEEEDEADEEDQDLDENSESLDELKAQNKNCGGGYGGLGIPICWKKCENVCNRILARLCIKLCRRQG